jgi:hypothetical protein
MKYFIYLKIEKFNSILIRKYRIEILILKNLHNFIISKILFKI